MSHQYIISKEMFSIISMEKNTFIPQTSNVRHNLSGTGVGIVGALLLNPALISMAAKMGSDHTIIEHNLVDSELATDTLSYGRTVEGFVYFQVQEEMWSADRLLLRLSARDVTNNSTLSIEMAFSPK